MATEMITVKLDGKFLDDIDSIVKKTGFHNRTEFIRNALREKVDEARIKEAMMSIAHLKGAFKMKMTDKEYEKVRSKVFKEYESKFK